MCFTATDATSEGAKLDVVEASSYQRPYPLEFRREAVSFRRRLGRDRYELLRQALAELRDPDPPTRQPNAP